MANIVCTALISKCIQLKIALISICLSLSYFYYLLKKLYLIDTQNGIEECEILGNDLATFRTL